MKLRPIWIAGRFLSRLPFPDPGQTAADEIGRSVPWYPWVGLVMGLPVLCSSFLLTNAPPPVAAALALILWVWVSGALHLDGLADSADAWVGGLGDRERTLAIMKDPTSGPAALTVVALVLIGKWSSLQVLVPAGNLWPFIAIPLLARAQILLLLLTTPYVRDQGMAAAQARYLPRRVCWLSLALAWLVVGLTGGWRGAALLLGALALFGLTRRAMLNRIGGFTGDTAGALVELTELLGLLLAAWLACGP
ncbi:adenosylcobinamide-GDP ribazoletransferase [Caldichromatium japonicum]|uniref:Adenosylcobinamide-GDP ribazoletransferase n=1 Tax=Caldichromatium japonicum TaxID=2699430 RepID=A0A6G7VDY1_9GAMM|nr:adenosylcobinamide-GDP ribazoletransferase [Caldichromatium japonicum]QIK38058.1 adenosylcobinamide-GDP ribazoletransferase [Caldichromatium japonicum]